MNPGRRVEEVKKEGAALCGSTTRGWSNVVKVEFEGRKKMKKPKARY